MSADEKVTLALPAEILEALAYLAEQSGRSVDSLATEALRRFVDREVPLFERIEEGMDDIAAGRIVSHEDAMAEIRAHIEARKNAEAA